MYINKSLIDRRVRRRMMITMVPLICLMVQTQRRRGRERPNPKEAAFSPGVGKREDLQVM